MKSLLLAVAGCFLLSLGAQAGEGWLTDYDDAVKKAKAENKQVLMDFTGSDWCGWCIKLKKEVFDTPEFQKYAAENLVLLEVDFPRNKPQTPKEKKDNEKLAEKYKIEGYPTIIVLNDKEKQIGQLGYMPGGPAAFIAALKKLK